MEQCRVSSIIVGVLLLFSVRRSEGIRFVIDREECFSHNIEYQRDTVHVSFVLIKPDSVWHYSKNGIDLVIKGPLGEQIHDSRDKTSDKLEFVAQSKGLHRFCFTNKSSYQHAIDFDLYISHLSSLYYHDDTHAKDEHFSPLMEEIAKLEEALYAAQFEQHMIEAQTHHQAYVNEIMTRRAIYKSVLESATLVGTSFLQVYLLRCLFERRLRLSRN